MIDGISNVRLLYRPVLDSRIPHLPEIPPAAARGTTATEAGTDHTASGWRRSATAVSAPPGTRASSRGGPPVANASEPGIQNPDITRSCLLPVAVDISVIGWSGSPPRSVGRRRVIGGGCLTAACTGSRTLMRRRPDGRRGAAYDR